MICKLKKFFVITLALMSFIILSILPASAVSVPNYGDYGSADDIYYIVLTDNNNCSCIITSDLPIVVQPHSSGSFMLITSYGGATLYDLSNNTSSTRGSNDVVLSVKSSDQILQCNFDIKYSGSDTVFFQQPTLLNQLLSLVPQGVGEKITTDLVTLTICGVACLALLIGLALLPKVLYKFL